MLSETAKRFYTIETETFELIEPTKEGHTFDGWYGDNTFNGEKFTYIEKGTFGDVELFAKWLINTYTATLPNLTDFNGCEILCENLSVEYNSPFTFSVRLSEAYSQSCDNLQVFLTWQSSLKKEEVFKNKEGLYEVESVIGNFEISLENISLNKYSVNFIADNNIIFTIEKEYGQSLEENELPDIPMAGKENYNQTQPYWETSSILNITKTENINAVYVPNVYEVTFVMEDGKQFSTYVIFGSSANYDILNENYDLNMFEYFEFDYPIDEISQDTVIKVSIKSNIFILYIVSGVIAGIIVIVTIASIIKKVKRNKFSWWTYAKPPKK